MPHHSISHQNTPDQTLVPRPPWPNLTYLYCIVHKCFLQVLFVKHRLHVCFRIDAVVSRPTLLPALLMFPSPLFLLSLLLASLFLGLDTCCGDQGLVL